ncbi:MAG: hypothetical protein ABFD07_19650 [Methanobacterium sp.]
MDKKKFEEIETVVEETFYGKNGVECDESEAFAKHMVVNGCSSYFLWFKNSVPFDPYMGEHIRRSSPMSKLKCVSKEMFDLYIKYLKTKQMIYITQCRRKFFK